MEKLVLSKNLRRKVLQGHPWIYIDALERGPNENGQLVQLLDHKKSFLAWAMTQVQSPLALRILSMKSQPPNQQFWHQAFSSALKKRQFLDTSSTNAFRLFNGEGDRLPGLVCDVYDKTAVMQFDGDAPRVFWSEAQVAQWILENLAIERVVHKPRGEKVLMLLAGKDFQGGTNPNLTSDLDIQIKENGLFFHVNIAQGQKTGTFLDQRDNRNYIGNFAKDKKVLNVFAYTGGFSVYCGRGGASSVISLDQSQPALDLAQRNWLANDLDPTKHRGIADNAFEFLAKTQESWDIIIVDPPSMAKSEGQKELAIRKYVDCFTQAARKVNPWGQLVLSSCSSHVSFQDFFTIIEESLSKARRKGQILRVSGQGPDHPFPHACPDFRYLKFVHLYLD